MVTIVTKRSLHLGSERLLSLEVLVKEEVEEHVQAVVPHNAPYLKIVSRTNYENQKEGLNAGFKTSSVGAAGPPMLVCTRAVSLRA